MNTNGQDGIKARKLKTIVVSIVAFIVILFVGIWAITGALSSGKKKTDNNKTVETIKTEEKKEETKTDTTNVPSPSDQYNAEQNQQNQQNTQTEAPVVENTPTTTNNIPTTGPAEIVFSALMLGVVASLVVLNVQLAKENQ